METAEIGVQAIPEQDNVALGFKILIVGFISFSFVFGLLCISTTHWRYRHADSVKIHSLEGQYFGLFSEGALFCKSRLGPNTTCRDLQFWYAATCYSTTGEYCECETLYEKWQPAVCEQLHDKETCNELRPIISRLKAGGLACAALSITAVALMVPGVAFVWIERWRGGLIIFAVCAIIQISGFSAWAATHTRKILLDSDLGYSAILAITHLVCTVLGVATTVLAMFLPRLHK
eukprot:Platyproteum_vivax@DN2421_c0_g1_i2.p1